MQLLVVVVLLVAQTVQHSLLLGLVLAAVPQRLWDLI